MPIQYELTRPADPGGNLLLFIDSVQPTGRQFDLGQLLNADADADQSIFLTFLIDRERCRVAAERV